MAFVGQPYHAPELDPTVAGISVLLFLLGIGAAYSVYAKGAPERDPTLHLGLATRLFSRKFYLDDLYLGAIVRPVREQVAQASYWLNQHVFDQSVVDGAVNGAGRTASFFGRGLRLLQNGNVQAYATGMFIGIVALAVIFSAR